MIDLGAGLQTATGDDQHLRVGVDPGEAAAG
jgi:hypothetical protein